MERKESDFLNCELYKYERLNFRRLSNILSDKMIGCKMLY